MLRPTRYVQVFFGGVNENFTPEAAKEIRAALRRGGANEWWDGESVYGGEISIRLTSIIAFVECTPETRVSYHDSVIEQKREVKEASAYPGEDASE